MTENFSRTRLEWQMAPEPTAAEVELVPTTIWARGALLTSLPYKIFAKHPNWFDPDFDLTLEVLATDPVVHSSHFYKESEEYFKKKQLSTEPMIDQDPQTRLNIFRANFHTKIDSACQLILADKELQSFGEWVGKDRAKKVVEAMTEFRSRIGIRKMLDTNMRELVAQLDSGFVPHTLESERRPLTEEERHNYMVRIHEAQKLSRVRMEEVNRGFALAELFDSYLQSTVEHKAISGNKKSRLFTRATKKFQSYLPIPTPPINQSKYKSQDIDPI